MTRMMTKEQRMCQNVGVVVLVLLTLLAFYTKLCSHDQCFKKIAGLKAEKAMLKQQLEDLTELYANRPDVEVAADDQ